MATPLLPHLLADVDPPLGVRGLTYEDDHKTFSGRIRNIIQATYIPDHQGKMHFVEVLHALAARVAGTHLPPSQEYGLQLQLAKRVPQLRGYVDREPLYTVAHYHAALSVQAAVRGYLVRYAKTKGMTGLWKMSFLAAVRTATMASRWGRKQDDVLSKWRRAGTTFVNRARFARAGGASMLLASVSSAGAAPEAPDKTDPASDERDNGAEGEMDEAMESAMREFRESDVRVLDAHVAAARLSRQASRSSLGQAGGAEAEAESAASPFPSLQPRRAGPAAGSSSADMPSTPLHAAAAAAAAASRFEEGVAGGGLTNEPAAAVHDQEELAPPPQQPPPRALAGASGGSAASDNNSAASQGTQGGSPVSPLPSPQAAPSAARLSLSQSQTGDNATPAATAAAATSSSKKQAGMYGLLGFLSHFGPAAALPASAGARPSSNASAVGPEVATSVAARSPVARPPRAARAFAALDRFRRVPVAQSPGRSLPVADKKADGNIAAAAAAAAAPASANEPQQQQRLALDTGPGGDLAPGAPLPPSESPDARRPTPPTGQLPPPAPPGGRARALRVASPAGTRRIEL